MDLVLECLRGRLSADRLREVRPAEKLLFVPALVLWARDDPEQLQSILAGVEDRRCVARAMAYACLDFPQILRNLEVNNAGGPSSMDTDGPGFDDDEEQSSDTCLEFEVAGERERVELALKSLRTCALKGGHDAGSIWINEAYLSELTLLLPIAVAHCPAFISSDCLVKGLLAARCGVQLLVTTVANNPYMVEQVVTSLAEFIKLETARYPKPSISRAAYLKQAPGLETAVWTLCKLSQVSRSFASACRDALVERLIVEELILLVTLEVLHDELEFLSGALFQKRSQWLLSYLSTSHKCMFTFPTLTGDDGLSSISGRIIDKEWLVLELRKALLKDARRIKLEKGWCAELQAHMKIYCVLIRTGDLHPTLEELDFWMKAILHHKGKSVSPSQRLLELGLSFLCLVPGLSTSSSMKALYHACVAYLLSPVKQAAGSSSAVELAVWLSVQLLLRHLSIIAEFVRESLGVHVTVHNTLMRDLAESSVAAGITSEPSILANAVAALRPVGNVTRTIACLEQLLHAGTFGRCAVDVSGSIMHIISQATEPVPLKMVQLIQMYVDTAVQQANVKGPLFKGLEFDKLLIEAISPAIPFFGYSQSHRDDRVSPSKALAPAALAAYLVLYREHLFRSLGLGAEEEKSWKDLISCVPWRQFLAYMETSWSKYENLLPQWLAFATALFPETFLVQKLVDSSIEAPAAEELEWLGLSDGECLSASFLQQAARKAADGPVFIIRILQGMCRRASAYSWDLKDVVGNPGFWSLESTLIEELLPVLLDPKCSLRLQIKFCEWWRMLPGAAKETLTVVFFKAVRVSSLIYTEFMKEEASVDYNTLVRDPLLYLSCCPRLFQTPLISIFLETLTEIMTVNRRLCESSLVVSGKDGALRREDIAAALVVQDSAVCQIMLERCLPDGDEAVFSHKAVCSTLSMLFHGNALLLKLVHFQGYDVRLIPVMIERVPCMIRCLEFLEELLRQQQQQKQVFGFHLAAHVTSRYPDESSSLPVAEKVVSQAVQMQSRVAGTSEFLRQVLQPVSDMAVTFPSLASKVVLLLQSCAQAGASLRKDGPPRDEKLHAAAVAAFKSLVRRRILFGQVPLA